MNIFIWFKNTKCRYGLAYQRRRVDRATFKVKKLKKVEQGKWLRDGSTNLLFTFQEVIFHKSKVRCWLKCCLISGISIYWSRYVNVLVDYATAVMWLSSWFKNVLGYSHSVWIKTYTFTRQNLPTFKSATRL